MKIQFLGTATAEGVPAIFCTCKHCRYAREKGGKEIRTRSGAMIDGTLKLDFCPDSYAHALRYGLDYSGTRSVLITHTHDDHVLVEDLGMRRPHFAHLPEGETLMTVYGNERLGDMMAPHTGEYLGFKRIIPFETMQIEDYKVTALEAVHCLDSKEKNTFPVIFEGKTYARKEEALFYLIEKKGLENTEVYKRAIVDKKVFSKIKSNPGYHPQKLTALCLCIGAKLNIDESRDLLARAGYALSPCDKTDIIFSFFIEHQIYDMIELDIQLEEHGLPCIIQ